MLRGPCLCGVDTNLYKVILLCFLEALETLDPGTGYCGFGTCRPLINHLPPLHVEGNGRYGCALPIRIGADRLFFSLLLPPSASKSGRLTTGLESNGQPDPSLARDYRLGKGPTSAQFCSPYHGRHQLAASSSRQVGRYSTFLLVVVVVGDEGVRRMRALRRSVSRKQVTN